MRIAEETPDLLVVEEAPWGFRVIILLFTGGMSWALLADWGGMTWFVRLAMSGFIALLWFILFAVALTVTARFDRGAGRIEIDRRGVFINRREVYSLRHLLRARVEESTDSEGSTYRLVLVFAEAMLAELDPETRARRDGERKPFAGMPTRTGRLAANEVPFTSYLTGGSKGPEETARRINAWTGTG